MKDYKVATKAPSFNEVGSISVKKINQIRKFQDQGYRHDLLRGSEKEVRKNG
jgi:hypothetical protein